MMWNAPLKRPGPIMALFTLLVHVLHLIYPRGGPGLPLAQGVAQ